jgi:hypothetical protein
LGGYRIKDLPETFKPFAGDHVLSFTEPVKHFESEFNLPKGFRQRCEFDCPFEIKTVAARDRIAKVQGVTLDELPP